MHSTENNTSMLDIRDDIKKINEIIPIPGIVTMILAQSLIGDIANKRLITLIESDVSLTSIVLRAANSAFYGIRSGVSTIDHAVMVLGYKEINRLVMTQDLKQRVITLNPDQKDFLNRLWIHSISTATTARTIAKSIGLSTIGEEFTAGLMHDMGKIVLMQQYPSEFSKTQQMVSDLGISDVQAEEQIFAISHDAIGSILVGNWNFPDLFVEVLRDHHRGGITMPNAIMTATVRLADLFCEQWGIGIDEWVGAYDISQDYSWRLLTEHVPALASQTFADFEENIRMEFENNQAFSELFA
jgi:HD-like signal output (HDOD) protein